jgi:hypothetical protein
MICSCVNLDRFVVRLLFTDPNFKPETFHGAGSLLIARFALDLNLVSQKVILWTLLTDKTYPHSAVWTLLTLIAWTVLPHTAFIPWTLLTHTNNRL